MSRFGTSSLSTLEASKNHKKFTFTACFWHVLNYKIRLKNIPEEYKRKVFSRVRQSVNKSGRMSTTGVSCLRARQMFFTQEESKVRVADLFIFPLFEETTFWSLILFTSFFREPKACQAKRCTFEIQNRQLQVVFLVHTIWTLLAFFMPELRAENFPLKLAKTCWPWKLNLWWEKPKWYVVTINKLDQPWRFVVRARALIVNLFILAWVVSWALILVLENQAQEGGLKKLEKRDLLASLARLRMQRQKLAAKQLCFGASRQNPKTKWKSKSHKLLQAAFTWSRSIEFVVKTRIKQTKWSRKKGSSERLSIIGRFEELFRLQTSSRVF